MVSGRVCIDCSITTQCSASEKVIHQWIHQWISLAAKASREVTPSTTRSGGKTHFESQIFSVQTRLESLMKTPSNVWSIWQFMFIQTPPRRFQHLGSSPTHLYRVTSSFSCCRCVGALVAWWLEPECLDFPISLNWTAPLVAPGLFPKNIII